MCAETHPLPLNSHLDDSTADKKCKKTPLSLKNLTDLDLSCCGNIFCLKKFLLSLSLTLLYWSCLSDALVWALKTVHLSYFVSSCLHLQALSAQEDLEKTKEELKTATTAVPAPPGGHAEHDEQDENHAEASEELCNEGVSQLDLRSEEERITEAQKNERVKKQLQVGGRSMSVSLRSKVSSLNQCGTDFLYVGAFHGGI